VTLALASFLVTVLALLGGGSVAAQGPASSEAPAPSPAAAAGAPTTAVPLDFSAIDARDAVVLVAEAGRLNLVASPGFRGPLGLDVKALPATEALRALAAARGHVVVSCGAVRALVPRARAAVPELPPLALSAGSPYTLATRAERSFDARQLLLALAHHARVSVVVGAGVDAQVLACLRSVPVQDALNAVAWSCGLTWTQLGTTLFVGTPEEVAEAAASYERSAAAP
jgi:hypothetical protein